MVVLVESRERMLSIEERKMSWLVTEKILEEAETAMAEA